MEILHSHSIHHSNYYFIATLYLLFVHVFEVFHKCHRSAYGKTCSLNLVEKDYAFDDGPKNDLENAIAYVEENSGDLKKFLLNVLMSKKNNTLLSHSWHLDRVVLKDFEKKIKLRIGIVSILTLNNLLSPPPTPRQRSHHHLLHLPFSCSDVVSKLNMTFNTLVIMISVLFVQCCHGVL